MTTSLRQEVRSLMTELRLHDMTAAELDALVNVLGDALLRTRSEGGQS
jgi:hypothetical protein